VQSNEVFCYSNWPFTVIKDRSKPIGNYKPISVLVSLSKVFERLIYNRLISFYQCNKIITPTQFDFKSKHSTIYAILDLTSCIDNIQNITSCIDNIQNKQYSTMVFLDIKKAFDSVSHIKLINKLQHYGIRGLANNVNSNLEYATYGVPQAQH